MTLCNATYHEFSEGDRVRGESYFQVHRVKSITRSVNRVDAIVTGTASYDVSVDWSDLDQAVVTVDCTCPRFEETFACKHLWAVFRKIEQNEYLPPDLPSIIELDYDSDEKDWEDEKGDGEGWWREDWDDEDASTVDARQFRKPRVGPHLVPPPPAGEGPSVPPEDWRALAGICQRDGSVERTVVIPEPLAKHRYWWVLIPSVRVAESETRIYCVSQVHRKGGGWGKPRLEVPPRYTPYQTQAPSRDTIFHEEICLAIGESSRLPGAKVVGWNDSYQSHKRDGFPISRTAAQAVLPRLCEHERFVWMLNVTDSLEEAHKIRWDDGPAYRFTVDAELDSDAGQWILRGAVQRGDEPPLPLDAVVAVVANRFLLFQDRLARFIAPPVLPVIDWFRAHHAVRVPLEDRQSFVREFVRAVNAEVIDVLPESLVGQRLTARMEPEFHIDPQRGARGDMGALVKFRYGDVEVDPASPPTFYDSERDVTVARNLAAERGSLESLHEALASERGYRFDGGWIYFAVKQLSELVGLLLRIDWRVRVAGHEIRHAGAVSFSVRSGIDWFELDSSVDFDGNQIPLPRLLRALKQGKTLITLDDGTQGLLPEEWLKRYGRLLELGEAEEDTIRFRPSQALILDALLAEQESASFDARFGDFRDKLASFQGVQPRNESRGFRGTLRPYQRQGLGWLRFLAEFGFGGCLADDMGLGKTVQVLALLQSRRTRRLKKGETRKPSLIVVPKSLVFNWIDEAARFAPRLRVMDYTGLGRAELRARMSAVDVVVTTYGTLCRDIAMLKDTVFDYAILDESTMIKNEKSLSAKACRLIQADSRLAMTGTPIENHLGELWSLFEFLNPGMLGSLRGFQTLVGKTARDEDYQWLSRAISPFFLRRTKEEVLQDLPKKTEKTIYCELSPKERARYNELRKYYQVLLSKKIDEQGLKKSKIHVLGALMRLRQAACHPGLLDTKQRGAESAKLDALLEHVREVVEENHKVLVFSQFTTLLGIVRDRLDAAGIRYEYLDGRTRKRKERVEHFQQDAHCPVFLISLKAGGHGLNLTAADYVFILDPWWNPAVEAQAVDRVHRIGQERPVFAYRFIAKDTVEEKVVELQQRKRELAEAVIAANESVIRTMTAKDLQLLLS